MLNLVNMFAVLAFGLSLPSRFSLLKFDGFSSSSQIFCTETIDYCRERKLMVGTCCFVDRHRSRHNRKKNITVFFCKILIRYVGRISWSSWYQLVPAGTSRYQLVPAGISWYQLVPAGTSRYQLVPTGISWYQLEPAGASLDQLVPDGTS